MEVEAAADLMAAGLVAQAIDGPDAAGAAVHHACANCQAPVHGRFCSQCGQSAHLHRSVLHLGEELLHGLLHFDAKGWRTLPLLVFRPGQLTRRYIDGQRTRFVSPLALFLFMVFVMFFAFSFTSVHSGSAAQKEQATQGGAAAVSDEPDLKLVQAQLDQAEAALAAARAAGRNVDAAAAAVARARVRRDATATALAGEDEDAAPAASVASAVASARGANSASPNPARKTNKHALKAVLSGKGSEAHFDTGSVWLDDALHHASSNPELTLYKLKSAASKYSFLLVPLSMPFLWLMFFWRRGITMYDHAVFTLYSLSFMALLMSTVAMLGKLGLGVVCALLVIGAPPLHMFAQLRGTYGLSRFGALWRTVVLLNVAGMVLIIYAVTVLALSAQH